MSALALVMLSGDVGISGVPTRCGEADDEGIFHLRQHSGLTKENLFVEGHLHHFGILGMDIVKNPIIFQEIQEIRGILSTPEHECEHEPFKARTLKGKKMRHNIISHSLKIIAISFDISHWPKWNYQWSGDVNQKVELKMSDVTLIFI
jgi:hypothetical protein